MNREDLLTELDNARKVMLDIHQKIEIFDNQEFSKAVFSTLLRGKLSSAARAWIMNWTLVSFSILYDDDGTTYLLRIKTRSKTLELAQAVNDDGIIKRIITLKDRQYILSWKTKQNEDSIRGAMDYMKEFGLKNLHEFISILRKTLQLAQEICDSKGEMHTLNINFNVGTSREEALWCAYYFPGVLSCADFPETFDASEEAVNEKAHK